MVRLRKAHGGLLPGDKMEETADTMRPRFDPNPDDPEGYLVNEFGLLPDTCPDAHADLLSLLAVGGK